DVEVAVDAVALYDAAAAVDQVVRRVERESAVAAVERLAALIEDEQAGALERQVGAVAGGLDSAVAEVAHHSGELDAEADLARIRAAAVGCRGTALRQVRRELGLEQRPVALETDRVDVRDVVADDVKRFRADVHPGQAREQCGGQ